MSSFATEPGRADRPNQQPEAPCAKSKNGNSVMHMRSAYIIERSGYCTAGPDDWALIKCHCSVDFSWKNWFLGSDAFRKKRKSLKHSI